MILCQWYFKNISSVKPFYFVTPQCTQKNYTLFLLKYSGINCVKIIKVNIRMSVQPKKSHMPCKISDSRPHRQSSRREKMDPSYFLIWNWRTSPTTKWVFEKWFKTLGVVEVYRMTDMVWYYYSSGVRTHWIIFFAEKRRRQTNGARLDGWFEAPNRQ